MSVFHQARLVAALILCLPCVAAAAPMQVMVSIQPLATFVKTIGGDRVDVSVMVPPAASPATYEPKPEQMGRLSKCALYLSAGVPFESAWLDRFQAVRDDLLVVPAHKGLDRMPMEHHEHGHIHDEHDDHGDKDSHDVHGDHGEGHGFVDPHVWLAPDMVRQMIENIYQALRFADPDNEQHYLQGLAAMQREVHETDRRVHEILGDLPLETPFMVYHPSWGYFARQYNLRQIPVEMEGKEPSPREMITLARLARQLELKVIFVQPQFSDTSARVIAANTGLRVEVADPMAANWSENLVHMARMIRDSRP